MYHIPTDDTWDARSIAESLRDRGLNACTVDDAVRITLPPKQPFSIMGKVIWNFFRPKPQSITISFSPEKFIRNVDLDYEPKKMSMDFPCFDEITEAMKQRGYLAQEDRKIAARYCPNSAELVKLFDEIDELQIQKEDLVAKWEFENASVVLDNERMIRDRIDAMLFKLVSRSTSTEEREE